MWYADASLSTGAIPHERMDCGMRKAKSRIKKKKMARRTPRRVENPAWLRDDPVGKAVSLPVRTRPSLLPFHELAWEDFERLCLRLSERGARAEAAWSYGKSGHTQYGIDVLVRVADRDSHHNCMHAHAPPS